MARCSIYDGNQGEWTLNEKSKGNISLETAVNLICQQNAYPHHNWQDDSEVGDYIGPERFFYGKNGEVVLVCSYTGGHGVWPYIVILHDKPETEETLRQLLLDNKVILPALELIDDDE